MIQRTVFCIAAVCIVGVLSSVSAGAPTSTVASTLGVTPTAPVASTSNAASSPSPQSSSTKPSLSPSVQSSPVATSSGAMTSTPLLSTSSPAIVSSGSLSPMTSSGTLVRSSSVISSAVVVSPSPTAVPVSESIVLQYPGSSKTCLKAVLDVVFDVRYSYKYQPNKTKNATVETNTTSIPLNGHKTFNYTGYCNKTEAYFNVRWTEHPSQNPDWKHEFSMLFDNSASDWTVKEVKAVFRTNDTFAFSAGAEKPIITATTNQIPGLDRVPEYSSYICDAGFDLEMSNVTAKFHKIILQPFYNAKREKEDGVHCPADKDDDDNTVPIAVGAALGGLVLIVLVAYVIGRRRSNRGYEQV